MISVIAGVAPVALGAIVGLFGAAVPLVIDFAKERWRTRFREQLGLAVKSGMLSYSDLQHIAERWNQDRKSVLQSLRVLLSDALSGEQADLAIATEHIRTLLRDHQSREPFAELPENISIQLANLSGTQPELIAQLAASLGELYSSNQRESKKQKRLGVLGFVVGVIGLLLSVPGVYLGFLK